MQRFDLLAYRLGNLRVTVPKSMDTYAGVQIHIFLPGRVVQVDSLAAYHLRCIVVEMVHARDQISPFLLKYCSGSNWSML